MEASQEISRTPRRLPPCSDVSVLQKTRMSHFWDTHHIAVFPILADVVEVKTGSRSTAYWSNEFIRLNGWLRNSFAQLITPFDIDGIGQNWEDSNTRTKFVDQQ